jgi:hypothetical protein
MDRLVVAVLIVMLAAGVAQLVRAKRRPDAPTQQRRQLPSQLDRQDFSRPEAPWLIVVFSSATCSTCADVIGKAAVLESHDVAVENVSYQEHRDRHERYQVDSVPSLVIAGPDGAVQFSVVGPISATDVWAAMAEVRDPGSVHGTGGSCHQHEDPNLES